MSLESSIKDNDGKQRLIKAGVQIPNPTSVYIDPAVDLKRIAAQGIILFPGARIMGAQTFIAPNAQIGAEGPVTLDNCYVGPGVSLKSGYFSQAVFLEKAACGAGSHVRQGTILEEGASIAHTVGLKQTILFPHVTLGSLINFCDCLMAGGTDSRNHSEVGSSYIHFNFTANQDKATPSLIGDVSRGVMLNQSPIFLGGQGGLVGPCRIAYGTVLAAGCICRKDQLKENHIIFEAPPPKASIPFKPGVFRGIKRILFNNFNYIANLTALHHWYKNIRAMFVGPHFPPELLEGVILTLASGFKERFRQLDGLRDKMAAAGAEGDLAQIFCSRWADLKEGLVDPGSTEGSPAQLDDFRAGLDERIELSDGDYIRAVKGLSPSQTDTGTQWLESIVNEFMEKTRQVLPI